MAPEFGDCGGTMLGATAREGPTRHQNYQNLSESQGSFCNLPGCCVPNRTVPARTRGDGDQGEVKIRLSPSAPRLVRYRPIPRTLIKRNTQIVEKYHGKVLDISNRDRALREEESRPVWKSPRGSRGRMRPSSEPVVTCRESLFPRPPPRPAQPP